MYLKFLCDVACQKLSKSANVSWSYSKNKSDTFFIETQCRSADGLAKCTSISCVSVTVGACSFMAWCVLYFGRISTLCVWRGNAHPQEAD